MNNDKLTEFVTVLLFALVLGGLGMLALLNLSGTWLSVSIAVLTVLAIVSWQYLRKRFGRS